jgi:hypothetical protein
MKLTLLKLSTILMLTFGTATGADAEVATAASADEILGKHFAIRVNTREKIGEGVLCGCNAKKIMTLSELLTAEGVEQTAETAITVFKSTANNGRVILTTEELAALGFTPDQNFGALPLSRLDALAFASNINQPPYFLSIIGTVSTSEENVLRQFISILERLSRLSIDQAPVVQGAQAVQNYLTMMFVLDRLTAVNASQTTEPATTEPKPVTGRD